MKANLDISVFKSLARTVTENSPDQLSDVYRGIRLTLDVTAVSGTTPTLDVKIQRLDPLSGKYVDLPSGAFSQKTGTGTDDLIIYPGISETANRSVSDCLGRLWRAVATIGGTTPSFTFSLGATYIP